MSDDRKLCKDCKHLKSYELYATPVGLAGGESNCEHPSLQELVYGNQLSIDAASRRNQNSVVDKCGWAGNQFEAGDRTPGIMQSKIDYMRECMAKNRERQSQERPAIVVHSLLENPKAWWELWK